MKVFFDKDAFWPYYTIVEKRLFTEELDIDEDIIHEYRKAQTLFLSAHKELEEAIKKAKARRT